jgi:hypothetical protein
MTRARPSEKLISRSTSFSRPMKENLTEMTTAIPLAVAEHNGKKEKGLLKRAVLKSFLNQSSAGAPTGQTSAQLPQEMQAASSMTYFESPSEIASTGHSAAHAPQEMQSSEIL